MQMRRFGLPIERTEAVFITHLHADHVLGLFGLIASLSMTGRREPLHIFADPSFESVLRENVRFFVVHLNFEICFHPVDPQHPDTVYSDPRFTVTTIPLRHRIATVGYLFRETPYQPNIRREAIAHHGLSLAEIAALKRGESVRSETATPIEPHDVTYYKRQPVSYAYLTDTLYSERAISFIQGVDLLYHEATYSDELLDLARQTGHSTASQAAQVALRAGATKLIIGHYSARYKDLAPLLDEARSLFPNTALAHEGEVHRIAWT